jgi:glutathione S-transferase
VVFGFKKLSWTSVLISRIMPRPDLMPLTGGYRRTPVMQIGADIYCDTQIIIRELDARFPNPPLLPRGNRGLPWALGMWTDRIFFQNTVNLVFGMLADQVPQDFIEDRSKLRGARFDIPSMKAAVPHMRDQFRAHLGWIEEQLSGRSWLFEEFSLADIHAYMNIWYARSNLSDAGTWLTEFPLTLDWANRVREIGHGTRSELSSAEALRLAALASPETAAQADGRDPNGLKPGDRVAAIPDDYGKVPVEGEIVSLSGQHIAIRRRDPQAGKIVVHFPRAGFHVMRRP